VDCGNGRIGSTGETTPLFWVKAIFSRDTPESRNRPPDIEGSKMLESRPLSLAGRASFPPGTPVELPPTTRFRPQMVVYLPRLQAKVANV
jgi:hypothetical protein